MTRDEITGQAGMQATRRLQSDGCRAFLAAGYRAAMREGRRLRTSDNALWRICEVTDEGLVVAPYKPRLPPERQPREPALFSFEQATRLFKLLRPTEELHVIPVELTAGTLWRIPGEVSVDVHVLAVVRRDDLGMTEVKYRFCGDTKLGIIDLAKTHEWTYLGNLTPCGADACQLGTCQRLKGHTGNHWSTKGEWPSTCHVCGADGAAVEWGDRLDEPKCEGCRRVQATVWSSGHLSDSLDRIIAELGRDDAMTPDVVALRKVVMAALDIGRSGRLKPGAFGRILSATRSAIGIASEAIDARHLNRSYAGLAEKLAEARQEAQWAMRRAILPAPARERLKPKPRELVVVDHGWDEPSDWTGRGPGILGSGSCLN